jgi:hypothetical protein
MLRQREHDEDGGYDDTNNVLTVPKVGYPFELVRLQQPLVLMHSSVSRPQIGELEELGRVCQTMLAADSLQSLFAFLLDETVVYEDDRYSFVRLNNGTEVASQPF